MAIIRRSDTGRDAARIPAWDPFEMMQEFFGGEALPRFTPSFEVKETKDAYVFKADVPGVKEEDVDISLTGNRLTISGKREAEKKDEGERYFTWERTFGAFSRSFTLPQGIDGENVQAELKDGVLSVVIGKRPEVQPRRIQVKGSGGSARA